MFCGKCGKKVEDGIEFCPYCGEAVSSGQEAGGASAPHAVPDVQPAAAPVMPDAGTGAAPLPAQEEAGNKRRRLGILAGLGAAAVLAAVLGIALSGGLLNGAKGTLAKAVAKSVNAYQAAYGATVMPALQKLNEAGRLRADISFQLKSFSDELTRYTPELEMLEGFGFRASSGYDRPGRKMDLSATASYGSADLITAWFQADGDVLSIGCPELLDGGTYGLSTVTLGRDLEALGVDMAEGAEDISFHLFDMMEALSKPVEVDASAYAALTEAIEVEKTGKSAVAVNGRDVDCTGYRVTVPEAAIQDYLDALEDAYKARELDGEVTALLRSMGMSGSELSASVDNGKLSAGLRQAVQAIGGVELEVYVNGGYVMAVEWEDEIEGTRLELTASFGGGAHYADGLSLELRAGELRMRCESTGNHGAEGGEYTGSSTFVIQEDGYGSYAIQSEMAYRPGQASDNFRWTVSGGGFSVTAEGQLTTTKDSLFADLDKLSVNAMGSEMLRLSAAYAVKPYAEPSLSSGAPTMLSDMDEEELADLAGDVAANAQSWVIGLFSGVPGLMELFW